MREAIIVLFAASVVFAMGIVVGGGIARDQVRQQAIEAGVAEWRIDAKTGERSFEWLKTEGE